jgi:hypothetical protein
MFCTRSKHKDRRRIEDPSLKAGQDTAIRPVSRTIRVAWGIVDVTAICSGSSLDIGHAGPALRISVAVDIDRPLESQYAALDHDVCHYGKFI